MDALDALGRDQAELRQMTAQRVDDHRALLDQQFPRLVQHQLSAHRLRAIARDPMNLKEILRQIDANSDKLLHGRSPRWWRSSDHVLALDAVRVGPSTPSLRGAQHEAIQPAAD